MADSKSTSKVCPRCTSAKPATAFGIDSKRPDGRYPICKQCRSARAREQHAADPEKARTRWRRWAAAHPGELGKYYANNSEKARARVREWHAANRAVANAAAKARYLRDKERRLAEGRRRRREHPETRWEVRNHERSLNQTRRWRAENPDKYRAQQRRSWLARHSGSRRAVTLAKRRLAEFNRRTRKHGAFVEHVDPRVVFARDGGVCGICAKPIAAQQKWHIDHVIPLARGGKHAYSNVQLSHARCNMSKGARLSAA